MTVFPGLLCYWNRTTEGLTFGGRASQWAFTCSKLTIETLEQGVKYIQS